MFSYVSLHSLSSVKVLPSVHQTPVFIEYLNLLTIVFISILLVRMDPLIMVVIQQSGSESSNKQQTVVTLKLIRCNLADLVIAHKLEKLETEIGNYVDYICHTSRRASITISSLPR